MTSDNHQPAKGIPLTLLASLTNAAMATTVKLIGEEASDFVIVFMRFFVSLILLISTIPFMKKPIHLKKLIQINKIGPYIIRIVTALGCLYCYFYALKQIPLSTAVVLMFTSPLFIPLVTKIWIKTPIPSPIWWALSTGFIGVILVVSPKFSFLHNGSLMGIAAGILSAISFVASRIQTKNEPIFNINFHLFSISSLLSFAIGGTSFIHEVHNFSLSVWLLLVSVGLFGFLYQFFLIRAVSYTRIRYVGAFLYFTIIFSYIAEWIFFDKIPSGITYLGILMIILAGILMSFLDPIKKKD
jgi:drug/metabolite transporter (DMT)-like permease